MFPRVVARPSVSFKLSRSASFKKSMSSLLVSGLGFPPVRFTVRVTEGSNAGWDWKVAAVAVSETGLTASLKVRVATPLSRSRV